MVYRSERGTSVVQTMKVSLSCWHGEEASNGNTRIRQLGLSFRVLPVVFPLYSLSSGPEDQMNKRVWGKVFYFISGFH